MSFIDDLIRKTLLAFFIEDKTSSALVDGFNAPLSTLSTRITAARSLGLMSSAEFSECNILRKIRNRFAHEIHISFSGAEMKNMCGQLKFAAQEYGDVKVKARGQFSTSSVALILSLTNRPTYVSRERCRAKDWPY